MFSTSNIICRNIHVTNVYKNVEARDQGSTLHDPIYLYFFLRNSAKIAGLLSNNNSSFEV